MRLTHLNLLGLVLLGLVCICQWRRENQLRQEAGKERRFSLGQSRELSELNTEKIRLAIDLELFRTQLKSQAEEVGKQSSARLAADAQARQSRLEVEQLKKSVGEWAAAVEVRDARFKDATAQNQLLSSRLQEAVASHRELSRRCEEAVTLLNQRTQDGNAVIEQLNQRNRDCAELTEKLNRRTEEYNELLKKPAAQ
jgi:hypothetical protein